MPEPVSNLNGTPFPNNQIPQSHDQSRFRPACSSIFSRCRIRARQMRLSTTTCRTSLRLSAAIRAMRAWTKTSHPSNPSLLRFTYKRRQNREAAVRTCASNNLNGSALGGPITIPQRTWSLIGRIQLRHHSAHRKRVPGWVDWPAPSQSYGISGSGIENELGLTPYITQSPQFLAERKYCCRTFVSRVSSARAAWAPIGSRPRPISSWTTSR